jgi:hypothetical protein
MALAFPFENSNHMVRRMEEADLVVPVNRGDRLRHHSAKIVK